MSCPLDSDFEPPRPGNDPESRLHTLTHELDALVPRDGAWIKFEQYGGGPDECSMLGNRIGYQRLGIEYLLAVIHAYPANATLNVDLDYLTAKHSDFRYETHELRDTPPPLRQPERARRMLQFGCFAGVLAAVILLLIGLTTVVQWIVT